MKHPSRQLMALLITSLWLYGCAAIPTESSSPDELTGRTANSAELGIPNGSSTDEPHLPWLTVADDPEYGFSTEKPILIGGILEGAGSEWSAQYFRSLLGPNGERTTFERLGSCCPFTVNDPALLAEGFESGRLDVYRVSVDSGSTVKVYVSIYFSGGLAAPIGFSTRGDGL